MRDIVNYIEEFQKLESDMQMEQRALLIYFFNQLSFVSLFLGGYKILLSCYFHVSLQFLFCQGGRPLILNDWNVKTWVNK